MKSKFNLHKSKIKSKLRSYLQNTDSILDTIRQLCWLTLQ